MGPGSPRRFGREDIIFGDEEDLRATPPLQ
jgi:hypothetical protein